MTYPILDDVDFGQNKLLNFRVQNLVTAPATPLVGQKYFDTTINSEMTWNGTAWVADDITKVSSGTIPLSKLATDPLARANHTGSQLAATISNFDTQVRTSTLNQMAAPTTALSVNNQKITSVGTPDPNSTDAANTIYVDAKVNNALAAIDPKDSVRVVVTSNVALTGLQTIDGITLVAGNRVLLTAQTTASQNGCYVAASGAWARSIDADTTGEITPGAFWFVEEGTLYAATQWRCNNTGTITIGTTSISIQQFGAAQMYSATNGVQLSGSQFSIKLDTNPGCSVSGNGLKIDPTVACVDTGTYLTRKKSVDVGDGVQTAYTFAHPFNSYDVDVTVYRNSGVREAVGVTIERPSTSSITIRFAKAPSLNQFRAVIIG